MAFDVILYPKNSLLVHENMIVVGVLSLSVLVVGLLFSQMGAWPILGFCGLEILVLSAAFYILHIRSRLRERIFLTQEHVVIEDYGWRGHKQSWQLPRPWIDVKSLAAPRAGIMISSKGQAVAIGSFLREEEKTSLVRALKSALRNY